VISAVPMLPDNGRRITSQPQSVKDRIHFGNRKVSDNAGRVPRGHVNRQLDVNLLVGVLYPDRVPARRQGQRKRRLDHLRQLHQAALVSGYFTNAPPRSCVDDDHPHLGGGGSFGRIRLDSTSIVHGDTGFDLMIRRNPRTIIRTTITTKPMQPPRIHG